MTDIANIQSLAVAADTVTNVQLVQPYADNTTIGTSFETICNTNADQVLPVIAGADIRHVPIGKNVDFFSELDNAIKNSYPKPKMLVLNFPSNPTTQCVEIEFFKSWKDII